MSRDARPVHEAIDRWERKGLIDGGLAVTLHQEASGEAAVGARRFGQYVLAATGAVVLLIAAGVFVDWSWPRMSLALRSAVIAAAGLVVHLGGVGLERRMRWRPAGYLMQSAGLVLLLVAAGYSEEAWADRSTGGILVGVLALAVPLVLAPGSFRRNVVMPAVHFCAGLAFFAMFLDRAGGMSEDDIVWIMDGVLLACTVVFIRLLARDPRGEVHPWALNAFVASLYVGFVMVAATAGGPLSLEEATAFPLDVWLLIVVALTLWGIHRAPEGLRRSWFTDQLAWAIVAWIPMGFWTTLEALEGPPELALIAVSGVGVAGLFYGSLQAARRVLSVSAVAFIAGIWYWAVERAGALGGVLALVATAALLFWISGRSGKRWEGSSG